MENNADVAFEIADADMETLKKMSGFSYGDNAEISVFKRVSK